MGFLIDSNIVIYYLSMQLPKNGMLFMNDVIDNVPLISVITQIEVLGFNNPPEVEVLFNEFISDSFIIPLNDDIIKATIQIRKENKIKTPDAIIAATAIILDHILISRNVEDFKKIKNLKLINPFSIE
jgi:predicted nucleic acid-binding protein